MIEPLAKRADGVAVKKRLFLVFYIGDERFALPATEVVEVLPLLPLKPVAHTPIWVAGVFSHRGHMVPVIDISAMTFGQTSVARTSTRLVLVNYRGHVLGVVLEQASDTLRCDPAEFQPYGVDNHDAPYLGPVRKDHHGLLQWLSVDDLLSPAESALLFANDPDDVGAQVPA